MPPNHHWCVTLLLTPFWLLFGGDFGRLPGSEVVVVRARRNCDHVEDCGPVHVLRDESDRSAVVGEPGPPCDGRKGQKQKWLNANGCPSTCASAIRLVVAFNLRVGDAFAYPKTTLDLAHGDPRRNRTWVWGVALTVTIINSYDVRVDRGGMANPKKVLAATPGLQPRPRILLGRRSMRKGHRCLSCCPATVLGG